MKGNALLFLVLIIFILDLFYSIPLGSFMKDSTENTVFVVLTTTIVKNLKELWINNAENEEKLVRVPEGYIIYFFNPFTIGKNSDTCNKIADTILKDSGLMAVIKNTPKLKESERLQIRKINELKKYIYEPCINAGVNEIKESVICIIGDYTKYKENSYLIPPKTINLFCKILNFPIGYYKKEDKKDKYYIETRILALYHKIECLDSFIFKTAEFCNNNKCKKLNSINFLDFTVNPNNACKFQHIKIN